MTNLRGLFQTALDYCKNKTAHFEGHAASWPVHLLCSSLTQVRGMEVVQDENIITINP